MWRKLTRSDGLAIGVVLCVTAAILIPKLPPGICFSDPGDLQLGSATLGIMHPTGYVGFAFVGYLLTLNPWVDPAYTVTLACLASGLLVLGLCMLMQIRLGVNAWVAGAVALALVTHERMWESLVAPEVYMPSLALVSSAAYLLLRYVRLGARRDLFLAVLLYGFALANRPPVLFFLPFFVLSWWSARRRWDGSWRRSAGTLGRAALIFLLPLLFSFVMLWVRDRPQVPYNYIEQHNVRTQELPESSAGWRAKLERIVWQVRGQQFADLMGTDWQQIRRKMHWLRHEIFPPQHQDVLVVAFMVVGVGLLCAFRECWSSTVLLVGMIVGSIVFVSVYRIHGQAADLLPLLFAAAVLGGVAIQSIRLPEMKPRVLQWIVAGFVLLGVVVGVRATDLVPVLIPTVLLGGVVLTLFLRTDPTKRSRGLGLLLVVGFLATLVLQMPQLIALFFAAAMLGGAAFAQIVPKPNASGTPWAAVGLVGLMAIVTAVGAKDQPPLGIGIDAKPFLKKLDMKTFPPDSLICAEWYHATALWYDRAIVSDRPDIEVMCTDSGRWKERVKQLPQRPVYVVNPTIKVDGYTLEPFRNVWRLMPTE